MLAFLLKKAYNIGGKVAMVMLINPEIERIAAAIGQAVPAEQIYLFGSYAYGTPNANSDYDFFLVMPDGAMRPMEAMRKAQRALARREQAMPIDILAATRSDFNAMKEQRNSIEKQVAQKGVLVFERRSPGLQMA
jgi:predicted nucleotidyltransferase